MSVYYKIKVAGLERELPLCRIKDDLYIAAFIIFGDVEITQACARELLQRAPEFDVLITSEAKGIPLAYEMARQSGKKYIVARKSAKLYMRNVHCAELTSITTLDRQILYLDGDDAEFLRGKRVLIVDDVVSTGQSLKAIEKLVNSVGGNIAAKMAVLAEGEAQNRTDVIYLEKLPLFNPDGTIKE